MSFRLTPRLNAPGRLGEAQRALDLLLADDDAEAHRRASEVDEINRERQRIQEEVWVEAVRAAEAERDAGRAALVLGGEGWHPGVVGIVAAKLVERFALPAVVVALKDGKGRGSARTLGGFDLHRALEACREHLIGCGGHAAAAGMSVDGACFAAFRDAFDAEARRHFSATSRDSEIQVDATAELGALDLGQVEELERLAPFGMANGEPLLAIPGVIVRGRRVVGNGHLQLTLAADGAIGDAIAFGMADRAPSEGASIDVIGIPEVDSFRGHRRIRLRVKHLLGAGP